MIYIGDKYIVTIETDGGTVTGFTVVNKTPPTEYTCTPVSLEQAKKIAPSFLAMVESCLKETAK